MPEAGGSKVEPPSSEPERSAYDAARGALGAALTTAVGEPEIDLVSETLERDGPGGDAQERHAPLVWRSPTDEPDDNAAAVTPAPSRDGLEPQPDLDAERDRWRERAIVWRERALAAEVVAKEMGAHLADVKENLEDVRVAMRALTEQQAAISARPARPRTGWRAYVAHLLDLDR